jgi:hypothetical protein
VTSNLIRRKRAHQKVEIVSLLHSDAPQAVRKAHHKRFSVSAVRCCWWWHSYHSRVLWPAMIIAYHNWFVLLADGELNFQKSQKRTKNSKIFCFVASQKSHDFSRENPHATRDLDSNLYLVLTHSSSNYSAITISPLSHLCLYSIWILLVFTF